VRGNEAEFTERGDGVSEDLEASDERAGDGERGGGVVLVEPRKELICVFGNSASGLLNAEEKDPSDD
jgi:hypothetical protein